MTQNCKGKAGVSCARFGFETAVSCNEHQRLLWAVTSTIATRLRSNTLTPVPMGIPSRNPAVAVFYKHHKNKPLPGTVCEQLFCGETPLPHRPSIENLLISWCAQYAIIMKMNNGITLFVFNASAQVIFFFGLLIPILLLAVYFYKNGRHKKNITLDFWQYRKLLLAILVIAVLVGASSFVMSGQWPISIIGVIAIIGVILILARRNFQLDIPLGVRFVGFIVCAAAFTKFLYWVTWGSVFFEIKFNRVAETVTVVYLLPQREVTLPLRNVNVAIQSATFPQYQKDLQIYIQDETNGKLYRSRQFKPRYKEEIETAISPVLPDTS